MVIVLAGNSSPRQIKSWCNVDFRMSCCKDTNPARRCILLSGPTADPARAGVEELRYERTFEPSAAAISATSTQRCNVNAAIYPRAVKRD